MKVGTALVFVFVGSSTVEAQAGPWQEHTIASGVVYAVEARAADFDGDGDLDTVSAALVGDKITVHENVGGTASAWSNHHVASVNGASALFPLDVDADGDLDIVSAAAFDDTAAWQENVDGQGTVWSQHIISTNTESVRDVFAVDVDGDGDPDVLTSSNRDNKVAWHENTSGNGSAWSEHLVATVGGAWDVCAGDIDGDGDPDVALAATNSVTWYENGSAGLLGWTETLITPSVLNARKVALGDFDGDGDLDVSSGTTAASSLEWHENLSGAGSAWSTHGLPPVASAPWVSVADMEGDGDLDLLSVSGSADTVDWHENVLGDASLWTKHGIYDSPSTGSESAEVADLDGDGDLDVVSADNSPGLVRWFENKVVSKSLVADVSGISLSQGGSQSFSFFADPPPPIHFYSLLGSVAGPVPGVVVDGLLLPLTPDAYFLYTLQNPNTTVLTNTVGTLAPNGTNTAPVSFNVPQGINPGLVGTNLYHAYAVVDLSTQPGSPFVSFVSDWVRVTLDP